MKRPVYLTGFMATGKSTVGPLAASLAGTTFHDLDLEIEQQAGLAIPEIFQRHGEPHFRLLEREALERHLADPTPRVVALGGGALLDRSLRLRALDAGHVVCLRASPAALAERLARAPGRPLLAGPDPLERVRSLLAAREEAYAEAHAHLDTDGASPALLAQALLDAVLPDPLLVAAGSRSYPVVVTHDSAPLRASLGALKPSSVLAFTDENVASHHLETIRSWCAGWPGGVEVLEAGESSKSLRGLERAWLALQGASLDRRGVVVAVGGGVVTDLAGFAAGTWQRGVRWLSVPTTLLGMVDAAIGGKTAIDLGPAKNVVGVFHQPRGVFADLSVLRTEPRRSFVSGLAEVVKSALVGDASLFSLCEEQPDGLLGGEAGTLERVVRSAAAVKARIVSRDERDQGERLLLNFGHTVGHAIESAGEFASRTHGEAVALGMIAALRLGEARGVTAPGLARRVVALLGRLGLPSRLERAEVERALPLLYHDKKRETDAVRFVWVEAPGRAHSSLTPWREIAENLLSLCDP